VYTLVSAPVLAADVVRHPHAVRLADTLDRVLALSAQEAAGLGAPATPDVRGRVLTACAATPRAAAELEHLTDALRDEGPTSRLAVRLESALLGTLADVHGLLLRESPVQALPREAQQVALDAVTSAWAGAAAAVSDVRALAARWEAALDPVPPPLPERPWTPEVRDLLEEVPRRGVAQWSVSLQHHRAGRSLRWSDTLHVACKAAWEADRLLDVARAQLAAARALALAHTGVAPYGAALVLTGAVQSVCTADLVPSSVREGLRAAWEAGAGSSIG
jgi:hypothetical protein